MDNGSPKSTKKGGIQQVFSVQGSQDHPCDELYVFETELESIQGSAANQELGQLTVARDAGTRLTGLLLRDEN